MFGRRGPPFGRRRFVLVTDADIVVLCFQAKPNADAIVPISTAFAKSSLTVTNVTRAIINASRLGILPKSLNEPQENEVWHTSSITPDKAPIRQRDQKLSLLYNTVRLVKVLTNVMMILTNWCLS